MVIFMRSIILQSFLWMAHTKRKPKPDRNLLSFPFFFFFPFASRNEERDHPGKADTEEINQNLGKKKKAKFNFLRKK